MPKALGYREPMNDGTYRPVVGDRALWGTRSDHLHEVVVVGPGVIETFVMVRITKEACSGKPDEPDRASREASIVSLQPMRPTRVGDRVRLIYSNDARGTVAQTAGDPKDSGSLFLVRYNVGGGDLAYFRADLVLTAEAEPPKRQWMFDSYVTNALSGIAESGSVTIEQMNDAKMIRWTERGEKFSMAADTTQRFIEWLRVTSFEERREVAREVTTTNAPPLPETAPTEWQMRQQNICALHGVRLRKKGETRVHWWLCGCEVKPEGEDFLGLVNGEPRGILVWGHGTYATGFMREEAVAKWRAKLMKHQEIDDDYGGPDDARHPSHPDRVTAAVAEFAARKAPPSS